MRNCFQYKLNPATAVGAALKRAAVDTRAMARCVAALVVSAIHGGVRTRL